MVRGRTVPVAAVDLMAPRHLTVAGFGTLPCGQVAGRSSGQTPLVLFMSCLFFPKVNKKVKH